MATEPTIMKMRLAEINRIVQNEDIKTRKDMQPWEVHVTIGKASVVEAIRAVLGSLPKGYTKGEPSLKSLAKKRFLMWRENQAKAEWKTLPESERKLWESYVEEGLEFGAIREKELKRAKDFEVGDRVVLTHTISYLRETYPAGSAGKITFIHHDEVKDTKAYKVWFDDEDLDSLNTYAHEIKRESK